MFPNYFTTAWMRNYRSAQVDKGKTSYLIPKYSLTQSDFKVRSWNLFSPWLDTEIKFGLLKLVADIASV